MVKEMEFTIASGGGVMTSIQHPLDGPPRTIFTAYAPGDELEVVARRKMMIAAAKVLDAATPDELAWLIDVKLENPRG